MPTLIEEVENFINEVHSLGETGDAMSSITATVAEAEDVAGGAAALEVGAEAATAVGTAMGGWIIVIVLLCIIPVLIALRWLENGIANLFGAVPWVGGRLKAGVHSMFSVLDGFENAVVGALVNAAAKVVTSFMHAVIDTVRGYFPWIAQEPVKVTVTTKTIQVIDQNVADLKNEVQQLKYSVQQLEHIVYGKPAQQGVTVTDFNTQLGQLQDTMVKVQAYLSQVDGKTQTNTNEIHALQHQVSNIEAELHGIRTTEVSWTEFQHITDQRLLGIDTLQAQMEAEQILQRQQITILNPLAILTVLGPAGIDNLRRLEQDPCQCPRIPELPLDVGAVLAAWLSFNYGL